MAGQRGRGANLPFPYLEVRAQAHMRERFGHGQGDLVPLCDLSKFDFSRGPAACADEMEPNALACDQVHVGRTPLCSCQQG